MGKIWCQETSVRSTCSTARDQKPALVIRDEEDGVVACNRVSGPGLGEQFERAIATAFRWRRRRSESTSDDTRKVASAHGR